MKKLFLTFAFLFFSISFFASNEYYFTPNSNLENKTSDNKQSSQEFETLSPVGAENMYYCRWRTVYHMSDGSTIYGPWTYGWCFDEIQLK